MLDAFLKVAFSREKASEHQNNLVDLMKQLPAEELYRIASGQEKFAFMGSDFDWLEKFKGTPLFEQAVQLEQEAIQLEVARKQQQEMDQEAWRAQDQLCLKKRLLSLQLAQQEQQAMTGGQSPTPSAPPATPAAAEPAAPTDAAGNPKSVTVKMGAAEVDFARTMGQQLARSDAASTKVALDLNALKGMAGGVAGRAAGAVGRAAQKYPGATYGALTGALGGAVSGAVPDSQGNTHILGGAARGAVGGAAVGHASDWLTRSGGIGGAARNAANKVQSAVAPAVTGA